MNVTGLSVSVNPINPNQTKQTTNPSENQGKQNAGEKSEQVNDGLKTKEAIAQQTRQARDELAKKTLTREAFTMETPDDLGARDSLSDFKAAALENLTINTNAIATSRLSDKSAAARSLTEVRDDFDTKGGVAVAAQTNVPSKEIVQHLLE